MGLTDIRAIVLDVDGVLTDGRLHLTESGEAVKVFYVQDGSAIKRWLSGGRQLAWLSGRSSPIVADRAAELGVVTVHQGIEDKLPVWLDIISAWNIPAEQVCCVGDDIADIPLLDHCGYAVAVANAVPAVKRHADYVTVASGGRGAVREVIDLLHEKVPV